MAYWLIAYAIGYLGIIGIIAKNRPLKGTDYVLLGLFALVWPVVIFGIIPLAAKSLIDLVEAPHDCVLQGDGLARYD